MAVICPPRNTSWRGGSSGQLVHKLREGVLGRSRHSPQAGNAIPGVCCPRGSASGFLTSYAAEFQKEAKTHPAAAVGAVCGCGMGQKSHQRPMKTWKGVGETSSSRASEEEVGSLKARPRRGLPTAFFLSFAS